MQAKFSSKREEVKVRRADMSQVDLQISELWTKLQQTKGRHKRVIIVGEN